MAICPLSAHLFLKSGQPETVAAQGFAGFLPTFPLFFTLKREKKVKKINKVENKSGLLARR